MSSLGHPVKYACTPSNTCNPSNKRIRSSNAKLVHLHHLSLHREGHWGTTDDFTTSFLRFSLFSFVLWDLANSGPVHFLVLSSHLFLCLPWILPPFTVPCKMVTARADERETCPYHCSLRLYDSQMHHTSLECKDQVMLNLFHPVKYTPQKSQHLKLLCWSQWYI